MNAGPSLRGLKHIGSGAYGRVYASREDEGVVFKRAMNDGTRDYLEWVILRTLEGRRMPGMPWVFGLWDEGAGRYRVSMRRYQPRDYRDYRDRQAYLNALNALIAAFEAETGVQANDVGGNNILMDDNGEWILTDPSSKDYSQSSSARRSSQRLN